MYVRVPGLENKLITTDVALPAEGSDVIVGLRPNKLIVREADSSLTVDIRERLGAWHMTI